MPRMSKAEKGMIEAGLISDRFEEEAQPPVWKGQIIFPDQIKTHEERIIYEKIYSDYPSKHLLRASVEPLLVQLCRHIVRSNQLSDLLSGPVSDPADYLKLLKAEKECTAAITSVSVKLKITPSAISSYRGTLLEQKEPPDERANKPWNYGKDPKDFI